MMMRRFDIRQKMKVIFHKQGFKINKFFIVYMIIYGISKIKLKNNIA